MLHHPAVFKLLSLSRRSVSILVPVCSRAAVLWNLLHWSYPRYALLTFADNTQGSKVSATLSLPVLQQQTHIRHISWSKPIRDSEGRTPNFCLWCIFAIPKSEARSLTWRSFSTRNMKALFMISVLKVQSARETLFPRLKCVCVCMCVSAL